MEMKENEIAFSFSDKDLIANLVVDRDESERLGVPVFKPNNSRFPSDPKEFTDEIRSTFANPKNWIVTKRVPYGKHLEENIYLGNMEEFIKSKIFADLVLNEFDIFKGRHSIGLYIEGEELACLLPGIVPHYDEEEYSNQPWTNSAYFEQYELDVRKIMLLFSSLIEKYQPAEIFLPFKIEL